MWKRRSKIKNLPWKFFIGEKKNLTRKQFQSNLTNTLLIWHKAIFEIFLKYEETDLEIKESFVFMYDGLLLHWGNKQTNKQNWDSM